jgi:hypothetical protein
MMVRYAPTITVPQCMLASDDEVRRVIRSWSDALDRHDFDTLGSLYDERVRYYGKLLPKGAVLNAKRAALRGAFRQQVAGEIVIRDGADNYEEFATFTKRSGVPDRMTEVRARLQVERDPPTGAWHIVEETDELSEGDASRRTP